MKQLWVFLFPLILASCTQSHLNDQVVSQKYIHKYGFELDKEEWAQRDQDGRIEQYLDSGIKVVKSYREGYLHGITSYTYPYSATVEKTLVYDEGELVKETIHDRKGMPIQQKNYLSEEEKMITYWSELGSPLRVETYQQGLLNEGLYYNAANELEGKVENGTGVRYKRMRDGTLIGMDDIQEGALVKRISYHPNGKEHIISYFQDYLLQGKQEIYTPEGNLYMVNEWDDGLLHGKKLAYRDGRLIIATNYRYGKKEGIETRFDAYGKLLSEVAYQDDERHGLSQYYGARNKVKEEWFYRGKPTTTERFDILTSKDLLIANIDE
ncbi:MAG: hypothetical protein AAGI90_03630 [Chlamydiota bacterium]